MNRVLAVAVLLLASVVQAASLSGSITDTSALGLGGMEVRLWQYSATSKGYTIAATTTSLGTGAYTFDPIVAGTYKLDARMGFGTSGNYGDRWYDVAAPTASGYVGADADELVVASTDALTGIDIVLEVFGGIDGLTRNGGGALISGVLVRAEWVVDRRVHHNDVSQASPHLGEYYMRGLPPGGYRVIGYDQNGVLDTTLLSTTPVVAAGSNVVAPALVLPAAPLDPYEPNNTPDDADAGIDSSLFRQLPPLAFTTAGSRIGPRNTGDVDFYCFDALAGDRYVVATEATVANVLPDGGSIESPWVDPVVSWWGAPDDGGTTLERLADDDDSGPMSRDALLDTGVLNTDGRYCAAVTTFGDLGWTGTTQGSAGAFTLSVAMGNRRPLLATEYLAAPTPVPPAAISINETDTLNIDATWSDPDNDALSATWELRDAADQLAAGASFNGSLGAGTATWTASQTAAQVSPYTLTVAVADAEFTVSTTTIITVASVNVPPSTPVQVSPADQSTVTDSAPLLTCSPSTDVDLDPLQYEFEVYLPGALDAGTPSLQGLVDGPDAGSVEFDGGAYPENTWVQWRVRAYDGQATSAYSPWTGLWSFFVDVVNDPPEAPVIAKPTDGEEVLVRLPVISATNPTDPEGDTVTLVFQVAEDSSFTTGVQTSGTVPVNTTGITTGWPVPLELAWGRAYYAHAKALDDRGGDSGYGPVRQFRLKPNIAPGVPVFGAPFETECNNLVVTPAPASIVVQVVADPEMEPVTVQVRVFAPNADPNSATPLFDETKAQAASADTTFDVNAVAWVEDGQHRVQSRASDGTDTTDWAECQITLDALPNEMDGGAGGGAGGGTGGGSGGGTGTGGGTGGGSGGGDPTAKPGCGCTSGVDGWLGLLAVAGLWLRRRRGLA